MENQVTEKKEEVKGLTKKDYSDAIFVQSACNLSGVVYAFSQILHRMWQDPECKGTDWVNHHPITKLFANKIADLSGQFCDGYPIESEQICADKSK